jgi:hypothetical protein
MVPLIPPRPAWARAAVAVIKTMRRVDRIHFTITMHGFPAFTLGLQKDAWTFLFKRLNIGEA